MFDVLLPISLSTHSSPAVLFLLEGVHLCTKSAHLHMSVAGEVGRTASPRHLQRRGRASLSLAGFLCPGACREKSPQYPHQPSHQPNSLHDAAVSDTDRQRCPSSFRKEKPCSIRCVTNRSVAHVQVCPEHPVSRDRTSASMDVQPGLSVLVRAKSEAEVLSQQLIP